LQFLIPFCIINKISYSTMQEKDPYFDLIMDEDL